jgi:hypothetical protein
VEKIERTPPHRGTWPFLKRFPFRDEREFRIIYESVEEKIDNKKLAFTLNSIRKITLSPWLPTPVFENIKETIQSIPGCTGLKIVPSTLLENQRWRRAIG